MKAPLFSEILDICQAIAAASAKNDENSRHASYQQLIKLCAANENTPRDHPLQWEALADFTNDSEQAIEIYQKWLACAETLGFADYIASIYLSMAQRYEEMSMADKALMAVSQALELVDKVENQELVTDIRAYHKGIGSFE